MAGVSLRVGDTGLPGLNPPHIEEGSSCTAPEAEWTKNQILSYLAGGGFQQNICVSAGQEKSFSLNVALSEIEF